MYSISNAASTLAGILCPLIVQVLISSLGKTAGWQAAFALFGVGVGVPAVLHFYRHANTDVLKDFNMSAEEHCRALR